MRVPLLDLGPQYRDIRKEVLDVVKKVCDSGRYVLGENVAALEEEIAAYCGTRYAVGVASGTDALLLALMALDVGHGDRVVTTPYTFFATAGSIARLGAVPEFVDIDPLTYNIDPGKLEERLAACAASGAGVKAVFAVHLFGQCADMSSINAAARRYGVKVIEDAAQAIGAEYRSKRAGSLATMGCFSFYPTKNLGGIGDGGMITTDSKRLADKLRMLRVHGSHHRYYHRYVGVNSRLDEIQAAVLRVKLKYLDRWMEGRIANAARYRELFTKAGLEGVGLPVESHRCRHVFNQYVVRLKKRDALRAYLAGKGVGSEVYYPVPLHLQECFKGLGLGRGSMPVSEKAARETLALPIYPELKAGQQRYVVEQIARFYSGRSPAGRKSS
ncbi:MAG TPA: DegT/DnrJ/EryC1/StrS family aminotransferase [Deltaproteobacteria bacterium]|nr:DegT/DnrJ/EryC1/StrS family aminotransferase [Deltaproteobacteria bacterium]